MKKTAIKHVICAGVLFLTIAVMPVQTAQSCTRAVYLGPEETIITVRSMDWKADMGSNLWAFPRGMQRDGAAGPTSIRWTSKYGSVIASAFSVIRNVSVPLGISTPGQPNISSTIWRTVSDHKNKRYYFESTRSPNVFWVNLADMDFAAG